MIINILGHDYVFLYTPNMTRNTNCHGRLNSLAGLIEIDPSVVISQQKDALIHEILEGINSNLEYNLEHYKITGMACALQ